MELFYVEEHTSCSNYVTDVDSGFKLVTFAKGDTFVSDDIKNNYIVFVLEGKVEVSCNEFTNRHFDAKSIIFVPQASNVFGLAQTDCKLIVLIFNYHVSNICDKHTLSQYAKSCKNIDYNFIGLNFNSPIDIFLQLLEIYLSAGVCCAHMHEIKQKELFIIFRTAYSKEDMVNFFYPMLGEDIDFKSKVLEKYQIGYSIKEFSDALAMNETYFPKKFRKEFGISYHQWMLKQKAKHIQHKLTMPQASIKDILFEFKFADFSHFNRFCKDQFGCAPKEFIKKIRDEQP